MRLLLDTSALIAHSRQEPGWRAVQLLFERNDSVIFVASLTLTEFARRLRELGASPSEALAVVGSYRELFNDVIEIDEPVALAAFHLACRVEARLPLADSLIAAAASESASTLVHRDKHMASIPLGQVRQLDLSVATVAQ